MTDENDDNHAMTDEPDTEPDPVTDDTFQKKTTRRIGDPDATVIDDATTTTDVGTMNKRTDVVLHPCKCGNTEQELSAFSQCSRCREKCCPACRITISRRIRCPECAERDYHLDKAVFIALYLLDNGEIAAGDLFQQQIGMAAASLPEHNYLQLDAAVHDAPFPEDGAMRINMDNPLTAAGKEALHVGEQLYSEDDDVAELIEEITIQQVANNGSR